MRYAPRRNAPQARELCVHLRRRAVGAGRATTPNPAPRSCNRTPWHTSRAGIRGATSASARAIRQDDLSEVSTSSPRAASGRTELSCTSCRRSLASPTLRPPVTSARERRHDIAGRQCRARRRVEPRLMEYLRSPKMTKSATPAPAYGVLHVHNVLDRRASRPDRNRVPPTAMRISSPPLTVMPVCAPSRQAPQCLFTRFCRPRGHVGPASVEGDRDLADTLFVLADASRAAFDTVDRCASASSRLSPPSPIAPVYPASRHGWLATAGSAIASSEWRAPPRGSRSEHTEARSSAD